MPVLGDSGTAKPEVGQRRTADPAKVHAHDPMLAGTERRSDASRRIEFRAMTLAVLDAQRIALDNSRARAIARTVAESRPPDSNTMALRCSVTSLAGHVAPQNFVKLQLETHRQAVRQNPIRQERGRELRVAGREQDAAALRQPVLLQICLAPIVILRANRSRI